MGGIIGGCVGGSYVQLENLCKNIDYFNPLGRQPRRIVNRMSWGHHN